MKVRDSILTFLRDTKTFSHDAKDPETWIKGLEKFTNPQIFKANDYALRDAQDKAWRGLASERVGLVLGPPGTGKSHLLAWFIVGYIQACASEGRPCRVLITAFTRTAIEGLIAAVAERIKRHKIAGVETFYFGSQSSNSSVFENVELVGSTKPSIKTFCEKIDDLNIVVGATVWSAFRMLESGSLPNDEGLTAPVFDLVCVDEASQLPVGHGLIPLGALKPTGRIVVAGDDKQLPPIRAAREINLNGRILGGSLYAFLKSAEVAEFALEETFRLNRPLTKFPQQKFYSESYRSAISDAEGRLTLIENWQEGLNEWEKAALDPAFPICVLVHDGPTAASKNPFEASVVINLAQKFRERLQLDEIEAGISNEDFWGDRLAIVSPHRAHNAEIKKSFPKEEQKHAFVETVDRIQGKERDIVILSYCVSDSEFAIAEASFIFSPERLNVAITRARCKLVVIISRTLLDTIPSDQEIVDQAEILREFVFSSSFTGNFHLPDQGGSLVNIELRRVGFDDAIEELDLSIQGATPLKKIEIDNDLAALVTIIRDIALQSQFGSAPIWEIKKALARGDEVISDLVKLHHHGSISLEQRRAKKTGDLFWTARPLDDVRVVYSADKESVGLRIREVILALSAGNKGAFYDRVRDRFSWMDDNGNDVFRQALDAVEQEGLIEILRAQNGVERVKLKSIQEVVNPEQDEAPTPLLSDSDYEILNALEDLEVKRINFGLFEGWSSIPMIAANINRPRREVAQAVNRLEENGYLILAEEQRIRSRMAEIARELRYVKQRFAPEDADKRPFLVRSLKLETRDRHKPERDEKLSDVFEAAKKQAWCKEDHIKALDIVERGLRSLWGDAPQVAGFQKRSFLSIFSSWFGFGADTFVISADTGSGKTEAAVLPMIAAALVEKIQGANGCRAIVTYPRIRLATNQAQRLVGYLATIADEKNGALLTIGIQSGEIPRKFENLHQSFIDLGWQQISHDRYCFPLFPCPEETCGAPLTLEVGTGVSGADRLKCTICQWTFGGWIGSKDNLAQRPPTFFLPTTESLHQWMHDPRYGNIFGDDPSLSPPRAIVADEIHLYSHIHGAQVGYALRRLLGRCLYNATSDLSPLAVGMSATLGNPSESWGRLVGREEIEVISPNAGEASENPRGREYFYFVQPEVESRGLDIAGASSTIQSLMCLTHNMRRRRGKDGGFRSLVFLDSIDKLRRLHAAYLDAEEGKQLSHLRTSQFGDDPATGAPITKCCKQPLGCDHFRKGECWWFAANDTRQESVAGRLKPESPLRVSQRPVYSGVGGNVQDLVEESDTIFTTSSLEVGFDDPNMTLVYQHYSPQNLASFIQRKGRGGRGIDDRPITGVTLSIYSPRDTWWFRQPAKMINPSGFDVPLNADNYFVVKGQILSAILDGFSMFECRNSKSSWSSDLVPTEEAMSFASEYVGSLFGQQFREILEFDTANELWKAATKNLTGNTNGFEPFTRARNALEWMPSALFDTINLPTFSVVIPQSDGQPMVRREDIVFGLMSIAPGNVTRRYSTHDANWITPKNGYAPWFQSYAEGDVKFQKMAAGTDEFLSELPIEARETLGNDIEPQLCRPVRVSLERVGTFYGADWQPSYCLKENNDASKIEEMTPNSDRQQGIKHETQAELRGFPIVRANNERGATHEIEEKNKWLSALTSFTGEETEHENSGLLLLRSFWGSDCEVRIVKPKSDPIPFRQIFTHPETKKPMLHGFFVHTEGVQFHIDTQHLDTFVNALISELENDQKLKQWHVAQLMKYLVESKGRAIGLNSYESQRVSEIFAAAAGHQTLRGKLKSVLKRWDRENLADLMEETRRDVLSHHPLMSEKRVARVAQSCGTPEFRDLFKTVLDELKDKSTFSGYLRSVVLHSLSLLLRDSFIRWGFGDDRRVLSHVKLPIQFGPNSTDIITLAEIGSMGDGTARTFVKNLPNASREWSDEIFGQCQNASEDEVLLRFFNREQDHKRWRELSSDNLEEMSSLAEELECPYQRPPSTLLKILYDAEEVGFHRFDYYDVAKEIFDIGKSIEDARERKLSAFEMVSAVVEHSKNNSTSTVGKMLEAYRAAEKEMSEESLSPEARLADQIYRLCAHLCPDGCPACLHQNGDVMSGSLVMASTSRKILEKFLAF